jgi:hypothetical protein
MIKNIDRRGFLRTGFAGAAGMMAFSLIKEDRISDL